MPKEDKYKQVKKDVQRLIDNIRQREFFKINFDDVPLRGSTDLYDIRIAILREPAGDFLPVYGIYNKETGLRETETRQFKGAQDWAKSLTAVAKGGQLPGLEFDGKDVHEELGSA